MSSHFNEPSISDALGKQSDSANKEGLDASFQSKQTKMSNLTKNLLSSNSAGFVGVNNQEERQASEPPGYNSSVEPSQQGNISFNSASNDVFNPPSSSYQQANSFQSMSFRNNDNKQPQFVQESMNYIPTTHNTPTVVSTSYSSNHSYTPTYQGTFNSQPPASNQFVGSFKPGDATTHAIPTTNISMESANPSNTSDSVSSDHADTLNTHQRFTSSFPGNAYGQQANFNTFRPQLNRLPSVGSRNSSSPMYSGSNSLHQIPSKRSSQTFLFTEPDHYMTYKEFFNSLGTKDAQNNGDGGNGYEDHLNIIEYPVNDVIEMLSCLLSKIIEANDKLHPNHFENTVAIRQRLKEEKKHKRLSVDIDHKGVKDHENGNTVEDSDDEDDEMKNKYLANVLAFHGTNVPGISLHAYLARVLKYCPVTNEVFLSLLVYFDRIAKKANNLKSSDKDNTNGESGSSSEQLFVMDSYNIHRLIISGITVSSKFFSDIFYKNLRYAKVGGLPLEELNYLELQFLLLLDFKLMISVEDLQNYGDLLLRFWKREQLTNEIVNNPTKSMPENNLQSS